MYDTGGEVDALMNRCVRRTGAALDHQDDQHIEDDRPDRKIVAPAKDLEQEPLPLPTGAICRQRMASASGRASWHGTIGVFALLTDC